MRRKGEEVKRRLGEEDETMISYKILFI